MSLAEIDRLTGADQLMRPTPVRDRWGRWHRDPGGQWDWFYELEPVERKYIAGRHMNGVLGPDDVADRLHTDIDSAMAQWLSAIRLERCGDPLDDDYLSCEDDGMENYGWAGPDEVCNMLAIQRNTLVVWRRRNLGFPEPAFTLSNLPIWSISAVRDWAALTNRPTADIL